MFKENLHNSFVEFCKKNKFEINNQQIKIIDQLVKFIEPKKTIFNNIFNSKEKLCFYLHGNVGVGKTMLTNFVYEHLINKKTRIMLNKYFRVIVGTMVLLSLILTQFVHQNWMWFIVFIGVNLIQSAFTKWCLLETILLKLGVKK